jgi:hypothetical protein
LHGDRRSRAGGSSLCRSHLTDQRGWIQGLVAVHLELRRPAGCLEPPRILARAAPGGCLRCPGSSSD